MRAVQLFWLSCGSSLRWELTVQLEPTTRSVSDPVEVLDVCEGKHFAAGEQYNRTARLYTTPPPAAANRRPRSAGNVGFLQIRALLARSCQ